MIIKKYFHSCILIQENEKRILFDPGDFSFIEKKIVPEDIGPVDVIIITHSHADHYFPEAIQTFLNLAPAKIIANKELANLMKQDGIEPVSVADGETLEYEGFKIQAYSANHEALPVDVPQNTAYLINDTFLHPGDSFSVDVSVKCKVLALPVCAPWATRLSAVEFAKKLMPKTVIPIHDGYLKEFMLESEYKSSGEAIGRYAIEFHPLRLHQVFEY